MMSSIEETPREKATDVVAATVPVAVAKCITEDAGTEDRTESYIIARILKDHYARRIAKMEAKAASKSATKMGRAA